MTEQEQQAATRRLAEAMGWKQEQTGWAFVTFCWRLPDGSRRTKWNPFARLEDVRIVEDWIDSHELSEEYLGQLWRVCGETGVRYHGVDAAFQGMSVGAFATADQRAEAACRTIL